MIKTKSFWTGILTICGGMAMILNGDTTNGFQTIAIGASTVFIRQAIKNK